MLISKVIEQLTQLKEEHGDMECYIPDDGDVCYRVPVEGLQVEIPDLEDEYLTENASEKYCFIWSK